MHSTMYGNLCDNYADTGHIFALVSSLTILLVLARLPAGCFVDLFVCFTSSLVLDGGVCAGFRAIGRVLQGYCSQLGFGVHC